MEAGSRPNLPVSLGATRISIPATSVAIITTRSATSSKATISSGAWDRVSCTIAVEPPRRGAAPRALQPPGLQPEQGGHGLEVVLDPVVDLPDRRVLGHQLALAAAQLGDVAAQDQRPRPVAADDERDGPQLDPRAVALDLGVPG